MKPGYPVLYIATQVVTFSGTTEIPEDRNLEVSAVLFCAAGALKAVR
jgi:hypothetical protein